MRVCFALALCMWRNDWPPETKRIRESIVETFDVLRIPYEMDRVMDCWHPPQGPEEYRCFSSMNITYAECWVIKSKLNSLPSKTITVASNDEHSPEFKLCRLEMMCAKKITKERFE